MNRSIRTVAAYSRWCGTAKESECVSVFVFRHADQTHIKPIAGECAIGEFDRKNIPHESVRLKKAGIKYIKGFSISQYFDKCACSRNLASPQSSSSRDLLLIDFVTCRGLPSAAYDSSTCDVSKYFKNNQLVLTVNLCGKRDVYVSVGEQHLTDMISVSRRLGWGYL